ncbi:MAG: carboxymuconolactone decarboxylase family protein [Halobacteriales archaeon]|nr:carboxymuconolactone decarboxylase family protein [Halobacteriales archaeon]
MARVPYRDPEELPAEHRDLLYAPMSEQQTVNVFRAIGNNPAVLDSFRKYFGVLWTEAGLSGRERELVILATARATDTAYMWHQHVRLSRALDVDDDAIRAVSAGEFEALPGREPLLLRYATAVADGRVDDPLGEAAASAFEPDTVVGITMLAAGYVAVARALSALDVELEDAFVGWALEG